MKESAQRLEYSSFYLYIRAIWDYLQVIIVAFILVFGLIRPFIVEGFKIPSGSMEDTLLVGDRIFVCKFMYGIKIPGTKHRLFTYSNPKRGDVVVFIPPHDRKRYYIKRVVAVTGDTVKTKGRTLYVNGEKVDDAKYVKHTGYAFDFPLHQIPEGHVFAMGDNRENSSDSRVWGHVDVNDIKGQAFVVYWSYDSEQHQISRWNIFKRIRFGRIGHIIHSQKIP